MSIALALGQIEEAMGVLEDANRSDARYFAYKALMRARDYLAEAEAARLATAHYAPLSRVEGGQK